MRPTRWSSRWPLCALLGGLLYSCFGCENAPKAEEPRKILTVEETLGLVFTWFADSPSRHFYKQANPAAKDALYKILANPELEQFHQKVWIAIGYIGDKSDVKRLEQHLRNRFSGVLTLTEQRTINAMLHALGVMIARDIEGAKALAESMLQPEYWREAKFRLFHKPQPQRPSFEYEMISDAMYSYAMSLDADLHEKTQTVLRGIADPKERQMVERALDPKLLLSSARNVLANEYGRITAQERRELAENFNGDLKNPAPAHPPRDLSGEPPRAAIPAEARAGAEPILRHPVAPSERRTFAALRELGADVSLDENGHIEHVNWGGGRMADAAFDHLKRLAKLESLDIAAATVTDKALAILKDLPPLRQLTITRCKNITDAGLAHLEHQKSLERLELLYLPQVTNAGLQHIEHLPRLKALNLTEMSISDEGLKHLAGMPNLERLELLDTGISGEGLKHLKGLTKLRDLRLAGSPITDGGLRHLEEMNSLRYVSLGDTAGIESVVRFSDEALARLRRALPKAEIDVTRIPPP